MEMENVFEKLNELNARIDDLCVKYQILAKENAKLKSRNFRDVIYTALEVEKESLLGKGCR
jgi:archaellum component FlaC